MARFVSVCTPASRTFALLDLEIPTAIYMAHGDMTGTHFLHQPRAVSFDEGHDWSVRKGRIRMPPCDRDAWFVFVYGDPCCKACGKRAPMGAHFCPHCGTPTESLVVPSNSSEPKGETK